MNRFIRYTLLWSIFSGVMLLIAIGCASSTPEREMKIYKRHAIGFVCENDAGTDTVLVENMNSGAAPRKVGPYDAVDCKPTEISVRAETTWVADREPEPGEGVVADCYPIVNVGPSGTTMTNYRCYE